MTITVGIATCWGGKSLVETVKSLRRARGGKEIKIMVEADRTPLTQDVKTQLNELKVELRWNTVEGSQFKKIKQMIDRAQSDIFISTQDDITFDPDILDAVKMAFASNPKLTMVGVRVFPLASGTPVESALAVMIRLIDRVSSIWNEGNNYLAASGRFLAFRSDHFKKFKLPQTVVNGDMYMYLENKRLGGTFAKVSSGRIYIRPPNRIKDQIGPSSRFQYSQKELNSYFRFDIAKEYRVPMALLLGAFLHELFRHPIQAMLYVCVFVFTRLVKLPGDIVKNPVWKVDLSTKQTI